MEQQSISFEIPEQPSPPPRPSRDQHSVLERAAENALEAMERNWSNYEPDHYAPDDVFEEVMEAIQRNDCNGYRACRHLETRYGWDPDSELCDILDNPWISEALQAMVREWVVINNIQPKLTVGTKVNIRGNTFRRAEETGTIRSIANQTGEYIVRVEKDNKFIDRYVSYEEVSPSS